MKEEIIKEVAGMTKEGIIKSIDVLQREVPELIQQIFRWELTISIMGVLLGIVFLVPVLLSFTKKHREKIGKWICNNDLEPIYWLTPFSFISIGLTLFIINLIKALKIIIVPKLYLVNYIFNLVN